MFAWLRNKTKLQRLQSSYCKLMKNAYNMALKDKGKSDLLHKEACDILTEIKKMESNTSSSGTSHL